MEVAGACGSPQGGTCLYCDSHRNFIERHTGYLNLASAAGFLGDLYQAVAFQDLNILLNVFEVALDNLGKLIERTRMTGPNCTQECKPLARQKIAGSLDAGKADLFARSLRDPPPSASCLEGLDNIIHYVVDGSDGKADGFHLIAFRNRACAGHEIPYELSHRGEGIRFLGCADVSMVPLWMIVVFEAESAFSPRTRRMRAGSEYHRGAERCAGPSRTIS